MRAKGTHVYNSRRNQVLESSRYQVFHHVACEHVQVIGGKAMSYVDNSEMDALLSRVREDKADPSGKNRNVVAYDCWRMFEDLATRYKEECAMRSRDKRQSR